MSYSLIALYPILWLIRWAKRTENALDCSLNTTVRHILFPPTTREEKYKAKVAIDTFFQQTGDVLSAAVIFAGTNWFAFSVIEFALLNMILILFRLLPAYQIGRRNLELVGESPLSRAT